MRQFKFSFMLLSLISVATVGFGREVPDTTASSCGGGCCATGMTPNSTASVEQQRAKAAATMAPKPQGRPVAVVRYACPMHPDIVSNKPGTCPKCNMALVKAAQVGPVTTGDSSKGLKAMKRKLQREHKYRCCIVESCDACVSHGGCACREAVKKGRPVCGECYDGWKEGKGDVPGKTLTDIKRSKGH